MVKNISFHLLRVASQQPVIKPCDGLQEGALLGQSLQLLTHVTSSCKPMFNSRIEGDLPRLACFLKNLFRFVAFLGSEYVVYLGRSNGEWTGYGRQLFLLHERWVCKVSDLDTRLEVTGDVL